MLRVAINGFGRIGRNALRVAWDRPNVQIVAINDLGSPEVLAHLLTYDSVFRRFPHVVKAKGQSLVIDGKKTIPVYTEKEPSSLPWRKERVDVVIESTGFFTEKEQAEGHILAGAKAVVISAPSKTAPTFLMGVNHVDLTKRDVIVNNASCTTNSAGPVMAVLEEVFGVKKAMLSTIHSVTSGQNVVDGVPPGRKPDLRRARSVLGNIIPTDTGAATATAEAIPTLSKKFDGISIRVPTPDVSLTDVTVLLKRKTTVEEVNAAFVSATKEKRWKGTLDVTNDPVVSSDMIGNPHGAIVDLSMTRVVDGDLVKVLAWYDNEWGYTVQLLRMVEEIGRHVR